MIVGERLKQIREAKNMSQGDVEAKTGLLRCYTSRVENGHTVPSVETLEKYAHAFGVPIHSIFLEEGQQAQPLKLKTIQEEVVSERIVKPFLRFLPKISTGDRKLLLATAKTMANGGGKK